MAKHEIIASDRRPPPSGIRRFVYRPSVDGASGETSAKKGAWRDNRDWPSIKEQLARTVKRVPEVVINVKGSRRAKDDGPAAIEGVLRYMMYISRNGRLPTINERDDRLEGSDMIRQEHAAWDLDMQRMRSRAGEILHPSFNIIFSMPAMTDPDKMLDAVQAFAREKFQDHQYLMALHTQETDPADDPPEHPHVHLILRAENSYGQRIYIRKQDLRLWREQFAQELRLRGIEANATARAERGRSFKASRGAEWHLQKRYEKDVADGKNPKPPTARSARFLQAAQELQDWPSEPKPWEVAMAARRRDVLRELAQNSARLRIEGDVELADQVDRFIADMPALDTERQKIQRSLVEAVRLRRQALDREK